MTNDKEIIKKKTGYTIGNVKLGEHTFSKLYEEKDIIFDTRLGNFHLLPDLKSVSDEKIKIARSSVENKRSKLIKLIGERFKGNDNEACKINTHCGKGRSKVLNETGMLPFFDYIRVESKISDLAYDLMFIRFYISENKVNCNLCSYQFSFQKAKTYSCFAYPESEDGNSAKKFRNIIEYFNPQTTYSIDNDNDLKGIVEEFCDYININEAKICNSN